jgi:hypothetical protein
LILIRFIQYFQGCTCRCWYIKGSKRHSCRRN